MNDNSSDVETIITEKYGSSSTIMTYAKRENDLFEVTPPSSTILQSIQTVKNFFREVLLPYGYPDSVSDDYLEYQIWDTLQAFCSTIIGAFTTRAILKGVGVGNAEATALSAATTWILKEGTGMIGRIMFAWWKGNGLDSDCKKWRFFADILNDIAMVIELILPYLSIWSMQILCVTSVMKSIVGIAGGATRASITYHQAIKDNMAEISAKDGSQETVVNLIGSLTSIVLLNYFNNTRAEWVLIFTLIVLHLYTNYLAVKSLVFKNFNNQRMALVLNTYFHVGTVLSPTKINEKESVLLGKGLKVNNVCGFDIIMGHSIKDGLRSYKAADLQELLKVYRYQKFVLLMHLPRRVIYVALELGETTQDMITAYFHAVCLGIATCIYNKVELDIYVKRQLHHSNPITRLCTFMKAYDKGPAQSTRRFSHDTLIEINDYVQQEWTMFITALQINGWDLGSHSMECGEWRTDWKTFIKKVN